jgi:hypothetical protein
MRHSNQQQMVGDDLNNMNGEDVEHDPAVMNPITVGAMLSPSPQSLFEGIGGRKPARYFSFTE